MSQESEGIDARTLHQKILESNKLDFLCFAITPWHALGIDAFLLDLKNKTGKNPSGIIVINSHRQHGYLISENVFVSPQFAKVSFYKIEDENLDALRIVQGKFAFVNVLLRLLLVYLFKILFPLPTKKRKTLFIASPLHPNIFSIMIFSSVKTSCKFKPVYVAVDEGSGSYPVNKLKRILTYIRGRIFEFQPSGGFVRQKVSLAIHVANSIFFFLVLSSFSKTKYFLFKNAKMVSLGKPNQNIRKLLLNVLSLKFGNDKLQEQPSYRPKQNSVVIATQPFSEIDPQYAKIETEMVDRLLHICTKSKLNVIIKPHPREQNEKYIQYIQLSKYKDFVTIHDKNVPLEEYFMKEDKDKKILAMVGLITTALITARVLYEIDVISICKLLPNYSGNDYLAKASRDFFQLNHKVIYFPDTWEKLVEKIKAIAQ